MTATTKIKPPVAPATTKIKPPVAPATTKIKPPVAPAATKIAWPGASAFKPAIPAHKPELTDAEQADLDQLAPNFPRVPSISPADRPPLRRGSDRP